MSVMLVAGFIEFLEWADMASEDIARWRCIVIDILIVLFRKIR